LLVPPDAASGDTATIVLGAKNSVSPDELGLFENLKQRGVIETGLAYLILGWLLIQVADIVFGQLLLPQWAGTFVTVLVIAGFPIAIILSWFLEFRDGRAILHELTPQDARKRRFGRTYVSVIGALGIAAVLVFIYDKSIGLPEEAVPEQTIVDESLALPPVLDNSIAVLPFLNIDGSEETQIFADGLVDDVITRLSRVPDLLVASRGDAYALEPNSPSDKVRRRLRVAMYLEGSVQIEGDVVRIIVQMINSANGFHIQSRTFDRPREDIFDVRDEITSLTVANVRVALPAELQGSSLGVIEDPSLDAWVLYRQGIEASRLPTTMDSISSALGWFDAALAVDPEYAAAHAGKCTVFVSGYREVDDPAYIANAESSCATALSLNPNLDIVHTALGDLYRSTGRHEDAEAAYQRALSGDPTNAAALTGLGLTYQRLNRPNDAEAILRRATDVHPGNAAAFNSLGLFLFKSGRFEAAEAEYEHAVALKPEDLVYTSNLASAHMMQGDFESAARYFQKTIEIAPTKTAYSNLGLMHFYLGKYDAAIENHRAAIELQPNDYLARVNLGDTLWADGQPGEARQAYAEANELASEVLLINRNDPLVIMDLAWIKSGLGERDEARKLIDRAMELMPDDPYVYYYDGLIHNRDGNTSAALASLRTAVELGFPEVMLAGDANLANLRGDARFADLANGADR
jgi:tetratricopeptide (TPR) repeat protein